jgi:hypothetical protein
LYTQIFFYWRTSKYNGLFIWTAYIIYFIIWIVGKFTFEPFTYSDVYSGTISQIFQIGFGVWLLLAILKDNSNVWKDDPRFWIVSGIVFYTTAAFFLFGMFNVLLTLPRNIMFVIWIANMLFIVIQYVFFLRAFLCKPAPGTVGNYPS